MDKDVLFFVVSFIRPDSSSYTQLAAKPQTFSDTVAYMTRASDEHVRRLRRHYTFGKRNADADDLCSHRFAHYGVIQARNQRGEFPLPENFKTLHTNLKFAETFEE